MFYNTGIATYVWVLTNRKPEHRRCSLSCPFRSHYRLTFPTTG